jgi:hypothetical protein
VAHVLTLVIILGVIGGIVAGFILLVRRLGRSRHLIRAARTDAVRWQARAEGIDRQAKRMVDVTNQALEQTGVALEVAREIEKVSDQMDQLLGLVVGESAEQPAPPGSGRHARTELHVISDINDESVA